nr:NEDD4-binding protein 2-like 2 isoform X2 [Scatophagus argus]
MSHTKSSFHGIENPCVGVLERTEDGSDDSADKDAKCVSSDSSSPDGSVRQLVLKEVGLTSTTFIGPVFPPNTNTNTAKPDIEDTLSEFYKELEEIDTPGGANVDPGKPDAGFVQPSVPLKTSSSKGTADISEEKIKFAKANSYTAKPQPSWPHWYHNEPYWSRRPRPGTDLRSGRAAAFPQDQWRHPQTLNRPPNSRFHRPPFHRPPPPSAFPDPPNAQSHFSLNWSGSGPINQYQEEAHFPTFSSFPPPNVCCHPSQGFYGGSPHHFDRDERGDVHTDNVNVGWPGDSKEEWCPLGEADDRRQRYESEYELWEHRSQPTDNSNAYRSSLVLILMRGLPGSGKSTLARELVSTGPSGLILSTDDYFAHRGGYRYDAGLLGEAHEWNQRRAKAAMRDGRSPIIIDNTNIQAWEMKPYVKMGLDRGYRVDFCEPDTSWKFDPYELEKRNKHGVPQEKIAQMMDRFSFPISVDIVMSSQEPLHVSQRRRPEQPQMMKRNQDSH